MTEKESDEKITVKSQFELNALEETQALQTTKVEDIAKILLLENERGASGLNLIAMQYHKTGEISPVGRELIFDLLKKNKDKIIINPYVLENLNKILEEFMCNIGYKRFELEQRIKFLKKR